MVPIVFATDKKFVIPTLVAIHSLLMAEIKTVYDIILLISKDVSEFDQKKFKAQVKHDSPDSTLRFILPHRDFSSVYIKDNRFSEVTYYRLFIPWLLPEYDKVIYADGDIVFNTDLASLYDNFEIDDNYFAGVNKSSYQEGERLQNILALGLNPNKYVNAGFLIINCKKQREDKLLKTFEKYLNKKFYDQDQDIINLVAKNKIALLPKEYNLPPDCIYKDRINNYKLIHYTLDGKPWDTITWGWLEWWNNYKELESIDEDYYFKTLQNIYHSAIENSKIPLPPTPTQILYNALCYKISQLNKALSRFLKK